MELEQRQRAYSRRASQQEDLAELRSRHEQFRSSMFSTSAGLAPTLSHGGSGVGSSGGGRSMDSERRVDRIEAALLAGRDLDAQRGASTFYPGTLTPDLSAGSGSGYQGVDPGSRQGAGRVGGGGTLFVPTSVPTPPGALHGVDGGTAYQTYHPQSGGGGIYPSRVLPADGSGASGGLARSDASHAAVLNEVGGSGGGVGGGIRGTSGGSRGGGSGGGGSGGGDSRGGGSGSSISGIFRYSEEAAHQHPHPHRADSGDTDGRGGGQSGSSAGGGSTERRRRPPIGEGGSSGENGNRRSWPRAQPGTASVATGAGDGTRGNGRDGGRGMPPVHQGSGSSGASDERRPEITGQEAFGPPEWDGDVTPVKAASGGTPLDGEGGDSGGVALTPKGYDEPLELPDGCHHISLSKFLEVMTGPGLRVRKHHRAGKGSSGLRVLRYAPDEDSLTWDSHKILGAAQHVLPMADVTSVEMQSGNRVVLTCVGGRDSYAVFEAANNDAGAVLYVGLKRLQKRTMS